MKKLIIALLTIATGWLAQAQNFSETEVTLQGNPGKLVGSYISTTDQSDLAALIIPGSGPTDRDGNNAMGLTNNSLKMVAEGLAENGISSLRIDKRGIAGSRSAALNESDLTLEAFVADAKSWIDLLTDSLGHQGVIVIGHSQGSLVGILAAQENAAVKALISLAGTSESIDRTILKQISVQAPVLVDETETVLDSLKMGYQVKNVNPMLMSLFRPSVQPFLISYIRFDPVREISKLDIPILILNGSTDIQVKADNAQALDSAAQDSQLVIIDQMNHVLKTAPEDMAKNAATYNQPDLELSAELMPAIINFIKNLN